MDKDLIVEYLKLFYTKGLNREQISQLLVSYCVEEMCKKDTMTIFLVDLLLQNPSECINCVKDALNYYKSKFFINILYGVIEEKTNQRNIILIF